MKEKKYKVITLFFVLTLLGIEQCEKDLIVKSLPAPSTARNCYSRGLPGWLSKSDFFGSVFSMCCVLGHYQAFSATSNKEVSGSEYLNETRFLWSRVVFLPRIPFQNTFLELAVLAEFRGTKELQRG